MTLYDAFGREVDTERLRDEQAAPTMTGIRNIYSSMHPSVGLTPGAAERRFCARPNSAIHFYTSSSPRRWKKRICTISRC